MRVSINSSGNYFPGFHPGKFDGVLLFPIPRTPEDRPMDPGNRKNKSN